MTTRKPQTAAACPRKCRGGRKCTCNAGHKAACICSRPDCQCHQPENYGLVLITRDRRAVYVPVEEVTP
jgi:hypothetical protein